MPSIPKLLAQAFGKQGDLGFRALTLTRVTAGQRTPGALSGGNNPTSTAYTCKGRQGVKRSGYWQFWQNAQTGTTSRAKFVGFTIMGGSLPDGVTPRAGDTITMASVVYTIAADGVSNPDGLGAVWECMTRAPGG